MAVASVNIENEVRSSQGSKGSQAKPDLTVIEMFQHLLKQGREFKETLVNLEKRVQIIEGQAAKGQCMILPSVSDHIIVQQPSPTKCVSLYEDKAEEALNTESKSMKSSSVNMIRIDQQHSLNKRIASHGDKAEQLIGRKPKIIAVGNGKINLPKIELEKYITVSSLKKFVMAMRRKLEEFGETKFSISSFPCALCKKGKKLWNIHRHLSKFHKMPEAATMCYKGVVERELNLKLLFTCPLCGLSGKKFNVHCRKHHPNIERKGFSYCQLKIVAEEDKDIAIKTASKDDEALESYLKRKENDELDPFDGPLIKQYRFNIGEILTSLNKQGLQITSLFTVNLRETVMNANGQKLQQGLASYCKGHATNQSSTLKNKINNFQAFMTDYILNTNISKSIMEAVKKNVQRLRRSLEEQDRNAKMIKINKGEELRVTLEDFYSIFNSQYYRDLKQLLINEEPIPEYASKVRDLVTFTVLSRNAQRPAAIYNLTVKEFRERTLQSNEHGDVWICKVFRHKNSKSGPILLCLAVPDVIDVVIAWYQKYRSISTEKIADDDVVFTTACGNKFEPGSLHNQHVLFAKLCNLEKPFSATLIRKMYKTYVSSMVPSLNHALDKFMCLSEKGADRVYEHTLNKAEAASVYNAINCASNILHPETAAERPVKETIRNSEMPSTSGLKRKMKTLHFQDDNDENSLSEKETCIKKPRIKDCRKSPQKCIEENAIKGKSNIALKVTRSINKREKKS